MPRVKELFFFDRFYDKGLDWYSKYFKDAGEQHRVVGEICHDYLFSPLACRRIARDLHNVKLMVCLREPGQRAFSEYLYRVKVGELSCDFKTALEEVDDLIDHGRYPKHLAPYLEYFGREHVFVTVFDDLVANPQLFFDCLCDFLNIERAILPSKLRESVLPAAKPRFRRLGKAFRWVGWNVRSLGFPGIVAMAKGSSMLDRLLYEPFGPGEKPKMPAETRAYLQEVFSSEVTNLDAILGTDLFHRWGYSNLSTQGVGTLAAQQEL